MMVFYTKAYHTIPYHTMQVHVLFMDDNLFGYTVSFAASRSNGNDVALYEVLITPTDKAETVCVCV